MGLSSKKTTTGPSKQAMPYLQAGSNAVTQAYNANQGNVSDVTNALKTAFDNYSVTNPNLTAAGGYVGDVLGGKYLEGNPYLQGIIDDTNSSVTDQVNSLFSRAGQTGSSRQIGELGKQLSRAENNLRYQNYSDEQTRMGNAVTQAAGLNSANNQNLATQLALGQGATSIGTDAANSYAQALASLWGNSTTTKQSGGLGSALLGIGGSVLGGWAGSGFK